MATSTAALWHPHVVNPLAPLAQALDAVGDRWTLLIVDSLVDGAKRFGEIEATVEGISTNVLAQRLRQLETESLVTARPYSRRPLRMSYALTGDGRALVSAIAALTAWGASRYGGDLPVHDACGTDLEMRVWCPTCEESVEPGSTDLHHL
ncbi:MAG: helix-turn-helix transcriptional regulator [Acidimicrobiia bacterium]|nr:helix-turn-helix transcriptional regulator [Acidimicrobiia bacterium]